MLDTRELDRRPGSTRHLHRTVDAPDGLAVPTAGVPAGSPLVLDIDIDSIVDGLWVAGTAEVSVTAECVRCLDEVGSVLTADLEALYVTAAAPETGRGRSDRHTTGRAGLEATDDSDDDEVFALDGDLLDLEQVVRDAVVLALPLQPLCSPDCPGLRLDGSRAESGQTTSEAVDPRWSALSGLLRVDPAPTRER